MNKVDLYLQSMKKWGLQSQLNMLAEECCELSIAALKQLRVVNGSDIDKLAEEIADVEIMCEQFRVCLQIDSDVNKWKILKLNRLSNILQESANNG